MLCPPPAPQGVLPRQRSPQAACAKPMSPGLNISLTHPRGSRTKPGPWPAPGGECIQRAPHRRPEAQAPRRLVVFLSNSTRMETEGGNPTKMLRPQQVCWPQWEVWTEAPAGTGWCDADARAERGPACGERDSEPSSSRTRRPFLLNWAPLPPGPLQIRPWRCL